MAHLPSPWLAVGVCTFTTLLACGEPAGTSASEEENGENAAMSEDANGDDDSSSPSNENDMLAPENMSPSLPESDAGREVCETLEAFARPNAPRVLVVVDRSGSMAGERWDQVTQGVAAIAEKFDNFALGLSMYPAIGEELACSAGKLDVSPAEGNAAKIKDALFADAARAQLDHGYTPTALTLNAAKESLKMSVDDERARYVLLVTDGKPNCKIGAAKYENDEPATYAALDALLTDEVRTFVIGYRTQDFKTVMDNMAVHGGTERHYAVENRAELEAALSQVGKSLAPCSYELDSAPAGPEYVRVLIDGKEVSYGDNGFTLPTSKSIELMGDVCTALRDGAEHAVKVLVECEPVRVL